MIRERVLIFLLAILGGIIFSIGLFYLYQKTKVVVSQKTPQEERKTQQPSPTPFFLEIENPQDEEIFDKKTIQLSGKTLPLAIVLVSLEDKELVLTPSADGSFSANITLIDGVNLIEVIAINTDGGNISVKRTTTFTTESF